MAMRGILGLFGFAILLSVVSCGAPLPDDPGTPDPNNRVTTLNLKGTWNFWMRHEIGSESSLVRGTMVVQEEFCDEGLCRISGLILKPQVATIGTQLPFSGVVLPNEEIIRLQYFDLNTSSEPLIVVVELDIFLKNYQPERTMIGHFLIFEQNDAGAVNEDTPMLLASGRGKLTMAGRVTAWPVIIKDPTRQEDLTEVK